MSNFKIGDKVVAKKSMKIIDELVAGQVYTVTSLGYNGAAVKLEGQKEPWGADNFELNPFQVGDEVKTSLRYNSYRVDAVWPDGKLDVSIPSSVDGFPRLSYYNQDPKLFTLVRRPADRVVIDEKAIEELKVYNDRLLERAVKAEDRARRAERDLEERYRPMEKLLEAERSENTRLVARIAETEHALRTARGSLCAEIDGLKKRNQSLEDKLAIIKDERNAVGSRYRDEAQNARNERDQARKDLEKSRQHCASQKRAITELNRCIVKRNDQLELARLERDEARDALQERKVAQFGSLLFNSFARDCAGFYDLKPFFVGVDFATKYAAKPAPEKPKPTHCGLRVGDRVKHNYTGKTGTIISLDGQSFDGHDFISIEFDDNPGADKGGWYADYCTLIPGGELRPGDKVRDLYPHSCGYDKGTFEFVRYYGEGQTYRWEKTVDKKRAWVDYKQHGGVCHGPADQLLRVIETER